MDLIVGHAKCPDGAFSTCVFSADYNQTIVSKRRFASITGDEVQILAVFLGRGSQAPEIHASLQEHVRCKIVGWFDTSPGEITDVVHYLLAPKSLANNFSRSVDKLIAPTDTQSDVSATKPGPTEPNLQDGKKPRVRIRK
jgi:hypothetical protein